MEKYKRAPLNAALAVNKYAGSEDFDVAQPEKSALHKNMTFLDTHAAVPTEEDIARILRLMGKTRKDQELNCGSCGYNTCREKAVAIFRGKAEISMCLPYLKEKAESFSDNIINNTPNAIIVLNENLEVQQINKAALRLMTNCATIWRAYAAWSIFLSGAYCDYIAHLSVRSFVSSSMKVLISLKLR